jgi:DNA-binding winged helix-turn-helix (wHTH) protein
MVTFDRFSFDPKSLELYADGSRVPLQQQPGRVLGLLLARRGELVTREELRLAIWGDETFVDFNRGLNFCVSQIRAALGDEPESPRFIETLRGRGYRFVSPEAKLELAPPPAPSRRHWLGMAAAAALILTPVAWEVAALRKGPEPAVAIAPFAASAGSEAWSATLRAQILAHLAYGDTRVVDATSAGVRPPSAWQLDARVDQSPEQYRVTVTLRDTGGAVRFSDIFDGPPGDWIEAQNEMARIISQAVRYNVERPSSVVGIERRVPRRKIPFS